MIPAAQFRNNEIIFGAVRGSAVFKIIAASTINNKFCVKTFYRDPSNEDGYSFCMETFDKYTEMADAYKRRLVKYHFIKEDDSNARSSNHCDQAGGR